jgi:hypothetical protein
MWPEGAEAVLELVKADPANASMANRWNEPSSNYPKTILAIIHMITKAKALEWIDANQPQAFYRPMFTGELD